MRKIIYIYFAVFLLNSCSVFTKYQNNRIEHYAVKLAKKNGNSFYVIYNSHYGIVWSYNNDLLYVYEIDKGRKKKYIYKVENRDWVNNFDLNELVKTNNCEAIDAQYMAQYKYDGSLSHYGVPLDIICIGKKLDEFSGINKEFVKDMKKYYIILLTQEDVDIFNRKNKSSEKIN